MGKRGQLTIFIVIGIVVITVIILTLYMYFASTSQKEQIPFEVSHVKEFVTLCLDEALESGVAYCSGGTKCPNFEEGLGEPVMIAFFDCTGAKGEKIQEKFPSYEITVGNADINIIKSKDQITATLSFPVMIKRDDKEHTIDTFLSEYKLKEIACIPCPTCDKNCRTQTPISVTVLDITWKFDAGDYVGIDGGNCLAC